jgi:hypothetical protein
MKKLSTTWKESRERKLTPENLMASGMNTLWYVYFLHGKIVPKEQLLSMFFLHYELV